jgi:hypothetical protein
MAISTLLMGIILFFEALSFLVSLLLCLRKDVHLYLRFFPIFLFITVVIESIGFMLRGEGFASRPMFNYFTAFEFVFYFFVLRLMIKDNRVRRIILYCTILYPVIAIVYILSRKFYDFHSLTYNIGAIAVVCFCVYYFYELFKTPVINSLLKEPSFWICAGLLVYYSCTVPLAGVINYLSPNIELEENLGRLILAITNFLLYSSFMVAFYCFLKFRNRTAVQ